MGKKMKSTLAKLVLLSTFGVMSIGSALAQPSCPTLTGTIDFAQKMKDGNWLAINFAPEGTSSLWEAILVSISDRDVTTAEDAIKRGQEILNTASWWPEASKNVLENKDYYYRCSYSIGEQFMALGDRVSLVSKDLPSGEVPSMRSSGTKEVKRSTFTQLLNKVK